MTVISLLRAVNIGKRKVPTSELRALYESLGLIGARTYIQSGNVVCKAQRHDLRKMRAKIEAAIKARFGLHSDVILRTIPEMNQVIAANPFPAHTAAHPAKVLVVFLAEDPGEAARKSVMDIDSSPEQVHAAGREMYIYYPNGMGRPKLPLAQIDRIIQTPGTGRNWNTVLKLRDLAIALETA